ncbi:protein-tyrosine phosphatase-like protein, partial [Syncephalis fuscata]
VNWTYNQRHAPQLVLPGLYIGSLQVSRSLPELRERGITHIIHACDSDGRPLPSSLTTMHSYNTSRHSLAAFSDASQFCRLAWANGSNVLIYCLTGIDASPVIAVAIIMEMTGMACVDAMHWVQMRRRCTN